MTLECQKSENAKLIFKKPTFKSLFIYEWSPQYNRYIRKDSVYSSSGTTLTYSVEEDLSTRRYDFYGTAVIVDRHDCGKIVYWGTERGVASIAGEAELVILNRRWYVETTGANSNQVERIFRVPVYSLSENGYINSRDNGVKPASNDYYSYISVYEGEKCAYNSPLGAKADLSIEFSYRFPVYRSSWFVSVFENEQLKTRIRVTSPPHEPFIIPNTLVEGVSTEESIDTEVLFTKEANFEAIEVVNNPSVPHQNLVYKVKLDEDLNEIDRQIIYYFESLSGQPPPEYELICQGLEQCEDDEYQLDCGNHYCCYKPDGIATNRIEK